VVITSPEVGAVGGALTDTVAMAKARKSMRDELRSALAVLAGAGLGVLVTGVSAAEYLPGTLAGITIGLVVGVARRRYHKSRQRGRHLSAPGNGP
jgi:hypothetical protein